MSRIASLSLIRVANLATFGIALMMLVGCGGSGDSQADAESGAPSTNTTESASADDDHRLVGVWLGIGYLDDEAVANKAATFATEQERAEFLAMAKSFQSTRLGVQFSRDESYEFDMEIVSMGGQVMRGTTRGSWKISAEEGEVVTVESSEVMEDGNTESQVAQYTFADEDHFAFVPPVHAVLLDCNPLIVFERQEGLAAETADQSDTNLR